MGRFILPIFFEDETLEQNLLSIKNLSIAYEKKENTVVKNINLTVKSGEVLAIVGESGSGKTSLIRGIMGILPPTGIVTSGEIIFGNTPLLNNKKYKKGHDIAYVFQNSGATLNPVLTIGQQFVEYIRTHKKMSKADAKKLAVETLTKVKLEDGEHIMNSYGFQLSGGMQQRVGIAMAIVFHPKLILADEPTSALDVTTQVQILDLFHEINENYGTSLVFVTHNLGAAAYLAEQCVVMYQGEVVEKNTMEGVISQAKHPYTKKLIQSSILEEMPHE